MEKKTVSKVFDNSDFGYLKMTVERPLRLNFAVNNDRIAQLDNEAAFVALAQSKKRKKQEDIDKEVAEGQALQQTILKMLEGMKSDELIMDRVLFLKLLKKATKAADLKLGAPLQKAILNALSEKDPKAAICKDTKGNPEPDSDLRDTELVPLPKGIALPLPLDYDKNPKNDALLLLVQDHCEDYLKKEVLPHVGDAWIDHKKTRVGYEIPLNRHFYVYEAPRALDEIETDIERVEKEIFGMLKEMKI